MRKVNLTSNKEADRETVPVEEVKCLVLKGIEEEEEEEEKVEVSNQKEDEAWIIDYLDIYLLISTNVWLTGHGRREACQQGCGADQQVEGGGEGVCPGEGCLQTGRLETHPLVRLISQSQSQIANCNNVRTWSLANLDFIGHDRIRGYHRS